jgi:quercetin dioxygenase-like cupin family protein
MRSETLPRELAAMPARNGRLAAVEATASAGFMTPLHAHGSEEAVRVLAGSMTIFAGEDVVRLGSGETFVVAAGIAHAHRAETPGTRAIFTTFARSAGRYEDFLRAAGPVAVDPSGAPTWSHDEDAGAVAAIAAAAEVTVLGPPGMLPTGSRDSARAA